MIEMIKTKLRKFVYSLTILVGGIAGLVGSLALSRYLYGPLVSFTEGQVSTIGQWIFAYPIVNITFISLIFFAIGKYLMGSQFFRNRTISREALLPWRWWIKVLAVGVIGGFWAGTLLSSAAFMLLLSRM